MTTAQLVFSIALGIVALVIVGFAAYVVATTMRTRRWTRQLHWPPSPRVPDASNAAEKPSAQ